MTSISRKPVLAFVAAVALALAGPAAAMPSMWVVHGRDCTVTLFGSMHVLPKGLDWEPPALKAALDQADELWFEIPLDEGYAQKAAAAAAARGMLPPGQALSRLLPADQAQRLAAIAKANNLSFAAIDRMQPWFADLLVSSLDYAKQGASDGAGVEQTLATAAPQAARKAFETADAQIGMLADAPQAVQIASLESTIKEADEDPREYEDLMDAWLRGDDHTLYHRDVLKLKQETPQLYDRLIDARNAAWTRVLAQRLAGHGHVVVVVGAGHLVGPGGTPARLRDLGFRVDGPAE